MDVRAFDAKGDGVQDDTVAIQAAINHAAANGGVVYLPAGKYLCGPLTVGGVAIVGSGVQQDPSGGVPNRGTQFRIVDNSAPFMTIKGGSVVLEGLNFFYPRQNGETAPPIQYEPTVNFCPDSKVTDVRISSCSFVNSYIALDMSVLDGFAIGRIRIERCNIYGIQDAIRIENARDVVSISDCILGPNAYATAVFLAGAHLASHTAAQGRGLVLRSADGVTLANTLIHGYATGVHAQQAYSFKVKQCLFECTHGIHLLGSYNSFAVSGCGFWAARKFDPTAVGHSVLLEPTGPFMTGVLSGNVFHFASGDHIRVMGGSDHCVVTVAGNSFRGWGRVSQAIADAAALRVASPAALVHCSGNTFRAESQLPTRNIHGVIISAADAVSIQGNQFFACEQAVSCTGGGACLVSGNMVRATQHATTSISVQGLPPSHVLVTDNLTDRPVSTP